MTHEEADRIAKCAWLTGFAREYRSYTGKEQPGPDGWIIPEGPAYAYKIGYRRTGKRGATLHTIKGSSPLGYEQAIEDAMNNTCGLRCHESLAAALGRYKAHKAGL